MRIIGHSLGGALASLAALDFYLNFKPVGTSLESMTVRTYGCPCVGNKSFVDLYNESIKGQGSKDEHKSDGSKFSRTARQVNLLKDSKRYVIYMDPVPLLLSEISAFGYAHVNEKVEVNEIKRKHNVENYIRVSIGDPELDQVGCRLMWRVLSQSGRSKG